MNAACIVASGGLLDWIVDLSDWKRHLTHAHYLIRLVDGAWRDFNSPQRVFIPLSRLSVSTWLSQSLVMENRSDGVLWSCVGVENQRLTRTILLIGVKTDPIHEKSRLLTIDWKAVLESHLFVTVLILRKLVLLSLLLKHCYFRILNPENRSGLLCFLV